MADTKFFKTLKIKGEDFQVQPVWNELGMSELYFLSLLSRDEYTPVVTSRPTNDTTTYIDPASGNQAGFHSGQCVLYPDVNVEGGYGMAISMKVDTDGQGVPTQVYWFYLTDVQSNLKSLQTQLSAFPTIPNDGNTYGIRNGEAEIVAGDGEEVLVQDAPTAVSLALKSVNQESLAVGADDPLFPEVIALIPEDILNDIMASSVATLEMQTPAKSEEEKLKEAIEGYWELKAQREAMQAEMERKRLEAEQSVEPTETEEV